MSKTLVAGFLLALSIPWPTKATETEEAMYLLNQCRAAPDTPGDIACSNYIYGVMAGMLMGKIVGAQTLCLPNKVVGPDQARQIVEAYMRDHPEKLKESGGRLAVEAFKSAFACGNSN